MTTMTGSVDGYPKFLSMKHDSDRKETFVSLATPETVIGKKGVKLPKDIKARLLNVRESLDHTIFLVIDENTKININNYLDN